MKKMIRVLILSAVLYGGLQIAFAGSDVPTRAEDIQPLLPGMKIPAVVFSSVDGGKFDLLKETAEKPVILIFYRGGW